MLLIKYYQLGVVWKQRVTRMSNGKDNNDVIFLTQIENISKKISDLVNNGQYKKINELNEMNGTNEMNISNMTYLWRERRFV